MVNPGWVTTRQMIEMMQRIIKPERDFEYWKSEAEFLRRGAKAPRSNCILDVSKLLALGIKMRPVEEALEDALLRWQAVTPTMEFAARGAR